MIKIEKKMKDGSICKMTVPALNDLTRTIMEDPRYSIVEQWSSDEKEEK